MPRTITPGAVPESFTGRQAADTISNTGQPDDQAILARIRIEGDDQTIFGEGADAQGVTAPAIASGRVGIRTWLSGIYAKLSGILSVATAGSGTLYAGTLSATTSAAALPSQACSEVYVQNDPASTVNLLVGNSGSQPVSLAPGSGASIQVNNATLVYVRVASGTATVNWWARS